MTVSLLPKTKLLFKHVSPQGDSSLRPHSAALSGSTRLSRFLVQVINLAFTYKMSLKEMNQTQILASEKGLDWPLLVVKDQIQLRWVV